MTIEWVWCGAPTHEGARVKAGTDQATASLVVAENESLTDGTTFGPFAVIDDVLDVTVTGLTATTQYYYAVDDGAGPDMDWAGQFRTLAAAGEVWSGRIAVIGDAGAAGTPPEPSVTDRVSDRDTFHAVDEADPDLILHLGDLHYRDIGRLDEAHVAAPFEVDDYIDAYIDNLTYNRTLGPDAQQGRLFRRRPVSYVWDNHDFGFSTASHVDADGTLPHKAAAAEAYRRMVPHYPLPDTNAIYHSIRFGRIEIIMPDVRYYRTPASATDGPNKTKLGQNQKVWLEQKLATSGAEALVFVSPQQWVTRSTESDGWAVYQEEQQWVIDKFAEYGWTDRMVIVSASMHALGIDTGTKAPGGIPTYLMAGIDAGPPDSLDDLYDTGPTSVERGQWGTLDIDDDGSRIRITGTGWIEDAIWKTHSIEVVTPPPPPDPPAPPDAEQPPVVAVGAIRQEVHWVGIDDRTGRVIADLPDLSGETSRLLMAYTSSKLTMPLTQSGPSGLPIRVVEQATQPQGCSIVQIVNDLPVWAGRVLIRVGGSDPDLELAVASSEQYLLQRRVTARSYVGVDRALIGADLLTDAGSTDLGPGMALEIDMTLTGDVTDRDYMPSDLTTVYRALRELSGAGTLEWTIDLDWTDSSATVLRRIMRLKPRIGRQTATHPIFESDLDSDSHYTLTEDFSSGRYANVVSAYGDGEGVDLPRSDPQVDQVALDGGVPVVEHAVHARDVSDPNELNAIAAAELARLMHGVELWELDSALNSYPRIGIDAGLGDAAKWRLTGPRHPDGVEGDGRVIGWILDAAALRWKPQLLDPHETALNA